MCGFYVLGYYVCSLYIEQEIERFNLDSVRENLGSMRGILENDAIFFWFYHFLLWFHFGEILAFSLFNLVR